MITYNRLVTRYYANSDEEKPTAGVRNGDTLYETDTGFLYMFDEENGIWHLLTYDPDDPDKDSDIVGKGKVGYMKLVS